MMKRFRKTSKPTKRLRLRVYEMPSPLNLRWGWRFGSITRFFYIIQVFSGIRLCLHYESTVRGAFLRVVQIQRDMLDG